MTLPAARLLFSIADRGPLTYDYGAEPVDRRLIDAVISGAFAGERDLGMGRRKLVLSPLGWEAVRHAKHRDDPVLVLGIRLRPYTDAIRSKISRKKRPSISVTGEMRNRLRDAAHAQGKTVRNLCERAINAALDAAGAA